MFDHKFYVPILKGKEGELGALSKLDKETVNRLMPFIDIPRIETDLETGKPKNSLDVHLSKFAEKFKKNWTFEKPVFFDVFDIPLSERTDTGEHPLIYLFNCLRNNDLLSIPATGLDRDESYNDAVRTINSKDCNGACIRILLDDMENHECLEEDLNSLLSELCVAIEETHLVLDFRDTLIVDAVQQAKIVTKAINSISNITEYLTLTVAATAFPGSIAAIKTRSSGRIQRLELKLWKEIIKAEGEISRLPAFGDYGIQNPILLELDWRVIPLVPNIRYTTENEWFIVRGGTRKSFGGKQTYELARFLVGRDEFLDADFSWGDNYIQDCSLDKVGPGSMTTWRKVGTNHHLTLVADQIANHL